jgi:D-alanine-D-alanine ligase
VIYRTENSRPWKSYETVARDIAVALEQMGFKHVVMLPDDMNLPQRLKEENIHLVWLNTGGVQGYNPVSHTSAMLEMLGIPYIGHNSLNASTLDNKHVFKRELQALGIKTAPFVTWHPAQGAFEVNARFKSVFDNYSGPFVVKPISGRASLNVCIADTLTDVPRVAADIFRQTNNTVLIEAYLPGREFCVAVCGSVTHAHNRLTKAREPFAFSAVERVLEEGERIFTSMDVKAITEHRLRLITSGEQALKDQLYALARTIYWEFNLSYIVRLDVRADASGNLYVLEANPKPDLKRSTGAVTSLIAAGLCEHGLEYNDLILSLLSDRLDYLFTYQPGSTLHITELLD